MNGEKGMTAAMQSSSRMSCLQMSQAKTPVSRSNFRFRREEHLKRRNEIREVFGKGKQYNYSGVKLFVLKNDLPYNRICFTFSRVFKKNQASEWNAVARNRARRLGREAYRLLRPCLSGRESSSGEPSVREYGCHDMILLVYPESELKKNMALSDRLEQIEFLFSRAGLLG